MLEWLIVFLDVVHLVARGIFPLLFLHRLTGCPGRVSRFVLYLFLLFLLAALSLPESFVLGLEILVLLGIARFSLGRPWSVSGLGAVLAVYLWQLSWGIVDSLESMVFVYLPSEPLMSLSLCLASLASLAVCALSYYVALRFSRPLAGPAPFLLLPIAFSFAAEFYLLQNDYCAFVLPAPWMPGKHLGLLSLQLLGLGANLATLYAYRRICDGFAAQAALDSLAQAAHAQESYLHEAKARYDATRALRHDLQNHLSILSGLLSAEKTGEARQYLGKLQTAAAALSFPCQTGLPAVDVLLGEKLQWAACCGVVVDFSRLSLLRGEIDEFDLCILFANALDNAILACRDLPGERRVCLFGECQGDFLRLSFENPCADAPLPPAGVGLSNIEAVAKKYHGTLLVQQEEGRFCLDVLLNLSLPAEGIS